MAVTIEPGFYQVPAILADPALTGPLGADLDRAALARSPTCAASASRTTCSAPTATPRC